MSDQMCTRVIIIIIISLASSSLTSCLNVIYDLNSKAPPGWYLLGAGDILVTDFGGMALKGLFCTHNTTTIRWRSLTDYLQIAP